VPHTISCSSYCNVLYSADVAIVFLELQPRRHKFSNFKTASHIRRSSCCFAESTSEQTSEDFLKAQDQLYQMPCPKALRGFSFAFYHCMNPLAHFFFRAVALCLWSASSPASRHSTYYCVDHVMMPSDQRENRWNRCICYFCGKEKGRKRYLLAAVTSC